MDTGTSPKPITIRTTGIALSGLVCAPSQVSRGRVVALPGGGVGAGYWDCPPRPVLSLLRLAAQLGFEALALDRPGYGASADHDPQRLDLASQCEYLFDAIESWCAAGSFAGPVFLIGHSVGGVVALMMAAHTRSAMLAGVDVLGVPFRYPASATSEAVHSLAAAGGRVPVVTRETRRWLLFGPEGTYDADCFEYDGTCSRQMPALEYRDGLAAPGIWKDLLPHIRIPVQWTATEHEKMQETGAAMLAEVRQLLSGSPLSRTSLQPCSGHNASQHRIARAYHLRALAFFEECGAANAATLIPLS
jgi:pimeloyl-ACP methyl ester carboxylesterase